MLPAPLLLVLEARPLPLNLLPETLWLTAPPALVLHADGARAVREKHFHDRRLLAGRVGGIDSASVLARRFAPIAARRRAVRWAPSGSPRTRFPAPTACSSRSTRPYRSAARSTRSRSADRAARERRYG